MNSKLVIGLLFVSILLVGCTSSTVKKTEAKPSVEGIQGAAKAAATAEVKTFKVAKVSESLTNDKLTVTLNGFEFTDDVPYSSLGGLERSVTPEEVNTFAIVDVTVENVGDQPDYVAGITHFKVKDSEGYVYKQHTLATGRLDQSITGTLQPGDKVRGKLVFEVPKTAKGLQLIFDFGLLDQAQGYFELGGAK